MSEPEPWSNLWQDYDRVVVGRLLSVAGLFHPAGSLCEKHTLNKLPEAVLLGHLVAQTQHTADQLHAQRFL